MINYLKELILDTLVKSMPKDKYDNLWTMLGLGKVRGNKLFKGIWRAARVGGVTALLFFVTKVLPGFNLPPEYVPLVGVVAAAVEKWAREFLGVLDF